MKATDPSTSLFRRLTLVGYGAAAAAGAVTVGLIAGVANSSGTAVGQTPGTAPTTGVGATSDDCVPTYHADDDEDEHEHEDDRDENEQEDEQEHEDEDDRGVLPGSGSTGPIGSTCSPTSTATQNGANAPAPAPGGLGPAQPNGTVMGGSNGS